MVVDSQTKKMQQSNMLFKIIIKCTQCCMWCLEKTLRFITNYCYIYTAMQGSGFCRSCMATFKLILSWPAQLSINTLVRVLLGLIQCVGIPLGCAWLTNFILIENGKSEPIYATVCVALMALIITRVYGSVFSCTLDTLFVCAVRDKQDYGGIYMSDRLLKAFDLQKGKSTSSDDGGGSGGGGGSYVAE